jgi:hypothetical protein
MARLDLAYISLGPGMVDFAIILHKNMLFTIASIIFRI